MTPENLSKPEPAPKPNDKPAVWSMVVRDMHERDAEGRRKYGTPLQPFNGRKPLVDCYQEALDLVVYLRQEIAERDERGETKERLVDRIEALQREVRHLDAQKNAAYSERNQVVALLARLALRLGWKAGVAKHPSEDTAWEGDWRTIIFIDLPTGVDDVRVPIEHAVVTTNHRGERTPGTELCRYTLSGIDGDLAQHSWHRNGAGYLKRQSHLEAPTGYLHRIVAERMFGTIPEGFEVDHIDRNTLNCARDNLRLATPHAQKLNRAVTGKSVRQRKSGRWQATWGTPQITLGTFDTKEEAEAVAGKHLEALLEQARSEGQFRYPPQRTSQVSWHFHDSERHLLDGLPAYAGRWDGHTATEKYIRVNAYPVRAPHVP